MTPGKRVKKRVTDKVRSELNTHLAKVLAYHRQGHRYVANVHARKLVEQLIKMKLLDPVLPLRPIEDDPPPPVGVDPASPTM